MYFICKYDGHTNNYAEVKYICLDLKCDQQRKVCQNHLEKHRSHAIHCVEISFLPQILQKELNKLKRCCETITIESVKVKIQTKCNEIINTINELENLEQSISSIKIVSLLIKCYNCQIEDEIINICWTESDEVNKSTMQKIKDIYSFEQTNYLIFKHIQAGAILKLIQDYASACSIYQHALKLCEGQHNQESEEIQKQLTHLHLQTQNFTQVMSILYVLSKHPQNLTMTQISQFALEKLLYFLNKPYFFFIKEEFIEIANYFFVKEISHCVLLFICQLWEETIIFCQFEMKKYPQNQRVELRYAALIALCILRDFQAAISLVEESILIYPQDKNFLFWKIFFQVYYEQFDQFKNLLNNGKLMAIENSLSLNKILIIYNLYIEKYDECLKQLNIFQRIEPKNSFMKYLKTLILIQINNNQEAREFLNLHSSNNDRRDIASLRLKEQYQYALDLIEDVLQNHQDRQDLWTDKITTIYEMGNYELVKSEIKIITFIFPNGVYDVRKHLISTLAEFQLKNYVLAYQNLKILKQTIRHSPTLHLNFLEGQLLFALNRYEDADECFTICCEKNSEFLRGYFSKAIIMCYKGNFDKAINLFDKCLSLDPNFYAAIYNKGIALLHSNYTEAEKCFTQISSHYKRSQLFVVFCKLFQGQYKYGEAIQALNKITKYQKYVQIIRCATQIAQESYREAQNTLDQYFENKHKRKAMTDKMSEMCRGMILMKTKSIQDFQEWSMNAKSNDEFSDFSCQLDKAIALDEEPEYSKQFELLQYFLRNLILLKYDTKVLTTVTNKIDLFHGLIDLQHSFAYYIQNLFD